MKFLSHYIIFQDKFYKNHICEIGNVIRVYPFSQEIANTLFVEGLIIVGNKQLDNFNSKLRLLWDNNDIEGSSERINSLMSNHNLNYIDNQGYSLFFENDYNINL